MVIERQRRRANTRSQWIYLCICLPSLLVEVLAVHQQMEELRQQNATGQQHEVHEQVWTTNGILPWVLQEGRYGWLELLLVLCGSDVYDPFLPLLGFQMGLGILHWKATGQEIPKRRDDLQPQVLLHMHGIKHDIQILVDHRPLYHLVFR